MHGLTHKSHHIGILRMKLFRTRATIKETKFRITSLSTNKTKQNNIWANHESTLQNSANKMGYHLPDFFEHKIGSGKNMRHLLEGNGMAVSHAESCTILQKRS